MSYWTARRIAERNAEHIDNVHKAFTEAVITELLVYLCLSNTWDRISTREMTFIIYITRSTTLLGIHTYCNGLNHFQFIMS